MVSYRYMLPIVFGTLASLVYFLINRERNYLRSSSSSVWCLRDIRGNKMCKMTNVQVNFSSGEILFYLDNTSHLYGIKSYHDLHTIQLSSIQNHSLFFSNTTPVASHFQRNCDKSIDKAIAFARLKSDNVMHVIHDDILPLFVTMSQLCADDWALCSRMYHIVFMDDQDVGPFLFLYQLFSEMKIIDRRYNTETFCFNELNIGLNLESVWYEYGFQKPRGPIDDLYVSSALIHKFKAHIINRLMIPSSGYANKSAIILNRTNSRRLVNPSTLLRFAKEIFTEIQTWQIFDVSQAGTRDLIQKLVNTDLVIGVHGAELILSLFMPINSTIIEIAPFGLHPDLISFIKPLIDRHVLPFKYIGYYSADKNLSLPPSDTNHHLHGGISHLRTSEQMRIKALKQIKQVHCCSDPAFLYLMYQDIIISNKFKEALEKNVEAKQNINVVNSLMKWRYPGKVEASCHGVHKVLKAVWRVPTNVMACEVYFKVTFLADGHVLDYTSQESSMRLPISFSATSASMWISAVLKSNNLSGADSFVQCFIQT